DDKTLSERAYELDLRYPQPFTRVFKQHVDKRPKGLNGPSVNKSVADCIRQPYHALACSFYGF
ncbi:MAG: hypothetical protein ACXVML_17625, partial [Flavisolibacter sp.]